MKTATEYDVRGIDPHGDAIDIESYPTFAAAHRAFYAMRLSPEMPAAVLEKHVSYPIRGGMGYGSEYTTIDMRGSAEALRAWGEET